MHRDVSPDHAAVLHVLTAPQIVLRTAPYLDGEEPDFGGLGRECETMSSGEALLVRIARDLWTAERTVGLTDVARRLDARGFARVVEALKLARGPYGREVTAVLAAESRESELAA